MWERTQIQLKQITSRVHFWSHYSESQVSPAHTASQTCQRNQLNNTELTFFWLETNRLIERQQSSVLSPSQLLSHCAGLSPRESIVFHLPAFHLNTLPHKYFPSRTKLCLRCMRLGQKEKKKETPTTVSNCSKALILRSEIQLSNSTMNGNMTDYSYLLCIFPP